MATRIKSAELLDMASSLEANGFERNQATATVRAIAGSIEPFAVTPPVLAQELGSTEQGIVAETDRRFAEQNAVWDARFNDLKSDMDRRFAHQQATALEQYNDLKKEIRAVGTRQFVMMWGMVAIVVGAGVSDDYVKQLFS